MRTHDVFGIKPEISEHSYIDRGSLDTEFKKLIQRQQSHIAIRGASKAGKSWLRQRVMTDPIIVQCRFSYTTQDIFKDALARLDIRVEIEKSTTQAFKGKISAAGEAGFKLIAKASGNIELVGEYQNQEKNKAIGKDIDDLEYIASLIKASGRQLVIEDFHYLPVEEQREFAFDLKTLWDYKTLVVIIGVWNTENMLTTLNPDLAERIEELSVVWKTAELKQVLSKGCEMLNFRMIEKVSSELAEISYESVGLLQKLALRYLDDELELEEGSPEGTELVISDTGKVTDAAMHIAEQLNQLYQAFARRVCDGIRTRTNSTGIYAHAMAAIMDAGDRELTEGISANAIYTASHAKQPRIQIGNLKTVLTRFPELQVDADGRGLVLAYDSQHERISVVDKQLLLYRRFATVRWPWEDLIKEVSQLQLAFD
ncbi:hypothetical protein ACI2KO_10530 [Pseudomonas piscis]|uniref:ATP-binding protein n=1 Tax=Pseudomonas piscis TaxID=2614538 RepID=A0ABY9NQ54_9PSED|nr:hypothetical protein [Pseudomonas piscis]WMN20343.1 hypothetical protein QL104_13410 [Pseudomonas piscis]